MDAQTLKAEKREVFGRKVKKLRSKDILPANLYGKKIKSRAVQLSKADFEKVFEKTGETGLVDLVVNKKKSPVLIHNVQLDPVTDEVLHVDFLQVDLKEKVSTQVPVELVGEAPAEKEGKGTVVQQIDEIEVEAFPTDLPEKFEIDLTRLKEVDEAIKVADIDVESKKVKVKSDADQIIVKVEPPRKVEEEVLPEEEEKVEEEVVVEEGPVETEKKPDSKEGSEKRIEKKEKEKEEKALET